MASDELKGLFEFTNLGRSKLTKRVELTGERSLWKAILPHLMSKEVEWEYDLESNLGKIFVGGFREVGQFRKVLDSASDDIKQTK